MTNAFSTDDGNSWHVRVVGRFRVDGLQFAFLYDPTVNANEVIDLNSCFDRSNGVPPGCRLSGAWDINEHKVVVGSLRDESGTYVGGYAIDLAADTPMVDLLPTPAWLTISSSIARGPMKINENGDILIRCQDASGTWGSFLYNPGIYNGNPDVRAARDGIPQDFSDAYVPESQFIQGNSFLFQLNNPVIDPESLEVGAPRTSGWRYRGRICLPIYVGHLPSLRRLWLSGHLYRCAQ